MATEQNLSKLVFNRLSNEKYHELKTSGKLDNEEFYITPDLDTNPGLVQDYISNAIIKIPQHINLELSTDGTLTLKAGSVIYIPNGIDTFNELKIQSDFSRDAKVWNGLGIITYENGIDWAPLTNCVSSDTTPAEPQNGMLWYDTTNNIIKRYNGTDWLGTRSLPLAIFNASAESTEQEIIQIFNGMGYIGSVAFVLPGVQAIIPNGFNNVGKLNNYTAVVERVLIKDYAKDSLLGQNLPLTLTNGPLLSAGDMLYVEAENQMYKGSISELNKRTEIEIAKITTDSTQITSLTPQPIYNRILNSAQVYETINNSFEPLNTKFIQRKQSIYQGTENLTSTKITLKNDILRYVKTVAANDSFSIDKSQLISNNGNITFELILNMPSIVSFSLANITSKWLGGEAPDLSEAGQHWFAFTSLDNGATWIGSHEGRFNI